MNNGNLRTDLIPPVQAFPDIELISGDNPALASPNSPFILPFYQTKDTLDVDTYRTFIDNAIARFRHSETYTHYKGFLYSLGLDHCQILGNVSSEMATIEMHHNMLTIYDIAVIICEHILNTSGRISTFDLVNLLKEEHIHHRVQLVMLSLTAHQLVHNDDEFMVHPDMCFGNWYEFLERYKFGITQDIAFKILFFLKQALDLGCTNTDNMLKVREKIKDWSEKNDN